MQIGALTGSFSTYNYVSKRDYTLIKDRFTRNTHIAIDHLYKTNALTITYRDNDQTKTVDIIDVLIADTENNIKIIPGNRNAYHPKLNMVMFLDTHGAIFRKNHKKRWFKRNKGHNSPVALLSHELIHCYNECYETENYIARKRDHSHRGKKIDYDGRDLSFPNAEEAFVIKMTNQVAKRLGEDKRSNYGRTYYATKSVLSTKPASRK